MKLCIYLFVKSTSRDNEQYTIRHESINYTKPDIDSRLGIVKTVVYTTALNKTA